MGEMAQKSPEQFVGHPLTVPVFSMVKTIIKEYSNKRISHCESDFKQFMVPVVANGAALSQLMQNLLK